MTHVRPLPQLVIALLVGAVLAVLVLQASRVGQGPPVAAGPAAAAGPSSYAEAVARASPAVVSIVSSRTSQRQSAGRAPFPFPPHPAYGPRLPERAPPRASSSLGSGVILSADGLILTNRHIVADAEAIRVELADGRELPATLVGSDAETDLAVLRVSAAALPVAAMGDPKALRVGDVVLAIGNPFGIGQTVTMGIVSATGRSHLGISSIENFIQTDASINPGNSGGALVDARGDLVGINTAIYSQSGGSEGVGFAIPADLAAGVLRQVAAQGQVARGWIGVIGRSVTPQLADAFGLQAQTGVLVSTTLSDSPATRAGLRPGDVVTLVDGRPIATSYDLLEAIAEVGPGAEVDLELWRGSERIRTKTTTVVRPQAAQAQARP